MPRTSQRTSVFTESLIREMTRVAQRHGAINLAQGYPDFDPPAALVQAGKDAMDAGRHQYAITWGAPELRSALAAKLRRFTGLNVDEASELVVTCGATEAMMVAMMTVCDPGDRVGLFSPFYENYSADAILCGAEPVLVPLHPPDYRFDLDELRRAFACGLKAFVLCNPSNPCGRVFTRPELEAIASLAEEFDVFVLTDEVYEHIVFAPHRHTYFAALPGMFRRTLMCSSLSKTFSITGWRLGYVLAAPKVISRRGRCTISSPWERRRRCSTPSSPRSGSQTPIMPSLPPSMPGPGISCLATWTKRASPTRGPKEHTS